MSPGQPITLLALHVMAHLWKPIASHRLQGQQGSKGEHVHGWGLKTLAAGSAERVAWGGQQLPGSTTAFQLVRLPLDKEWCKKACTALSASGCILSIKG
jgi:hypothetical protein